jgi:hypothetical protein
MPSTTSRASQPGCIRAGSRHASPATLASPQHATGAGYVLFLRTQDGVEERARTYLLPSTGPAPFIETDAQGCDQAPDAYSLPPPLPDRSRSRPVAGRHTPRRRIPAISPTCATRLLPARLPAGSAVTDRHDTSGLVYALQTVTLRAGLLPPHRAASLTPPPGPTIKLGIPATTPQPGPHLAAVDYADSSPATSQPDQPARPSSPTPPASPDRADQPSIHPVVQLREGHASRRRTRSAQMRGPAPGRSNQLPVNT